MVKKTHYRQLARQAERRHASRSMERERRAKVLKGLAAILALALFTGGFLFFFRGSGEPDSSPSTDATETSEPEPTGSPGEILDYLIPDFDFGAVVACGGEFPEAMTDPKPQYSAPAQVLEENTKYYATFTTSCGEVVVKLLPETAPQTVNSFVFLAEEGYFDGQLFHRLDASLDVIQGGDPQGRGTGGPGYTIPDELTGDEVYGPGVLAMANAGPNTGGSQFFFIAGENGHLLDDQGAWTVFGEVVSGLEVLQAMIGLPITDPAGGIAGQRPVQPIYIDTVVISNG